ncbi:alpha/beta hydrolase [Sphingomonas sp.]|uniref:alpha/beta fold hydrolase n=1 Tax=Sphingomonas sp. TaxID=28214 RepID=UPI0025E8FBC7|nr:alpha/beta hydrolase [Sphingomonas sp.]
MTEKIHVTHWGDQGERVVLIHGSAQGSKIGGDRHFARQQGLAARGWQVIVPDRPGHGQSSDPGRPDDAEADAIWVAEMLQDGAHLVGHSFGGAVALAAAARRPDAVKSLTIIEPAMQKLAGDDPEVRKFVISLIRALLLTLSDAKRVQRFARVVNIPSFIDGDRPYDEMKAMGRAIRKLKIPAKADVARELAVVKQAKIPLMLVSGGWSPAFDVVSRRVAEAGGGFHQIITSPHHFPQSVSEEFNDRLDAFMRAADMTPAISAS